MGNCQSMQNFFAKNNGTFGQEYRPFYRTYGLPIMHNQQQQYFTPMQQHFGPHQQNFNNNNFRPPFQPQLSNPYPINNQPCPMPFSNPHTPYPFPQEPSIQPPAGPISVPQLPLSDLNLNLNPAEMSVFFQLLKGNSYHDGAANHDINRINSFMGTSFNNNHNQTLIGGSGLGKNLGKIVPSSGQNLFGLNLNNHNFKNNEFGFGEDLYNFDGNKTKYHEILDLSCFGGGASVNSNGSLFGGGLSFGSFGTRAY